MFAEHMRDAIAAAPRTRLAELSAAIWKAYAAGAVGEGDAQALAEAVEARRAVPPTRIAPRRVGSRPRSPESLERRRRWVASGWLPPQLACRFTMAEGAVLAVIAAEVGRRGLCRLTIGHVAALAGVCRTTVKNAVRQAAALGLIRSEEWRLSAWRSAPNTVTILSAEWSTWLRLATRRGRGQNRDHHEQSSIHQARAGYEQMRSGGDETAKVGPNRQREGSRHEHQERVAGAGGQPGPGAHRRGRPDG